MIFLKIAGDKVTINRGKQLKKREGAYMEVNDFGEVELERYVTKVMLEVGVPAHLKGYLFLREASMISGRDMETVSSVTKLLYPEVSKRCKTTNQKVERAIRNAIESSWKRGNVKSIEELFGYSIANGRKRPTNSEYIARIADKIRLDVKAM